MVLQAHQFISANLHNPCYTVKHANGKRSSHSNVTRAAATDHELCYYFYITIDELLNPESDERLVPCTVSLYDSCVTPQTTI